MSKPRTIDIKRMSRYVARTTPDVVRRTFDASMADDPREYHDWLEDFRARMVVKHPHATGIHVSATPAHESNFDLYTVEARVKHDKESR